MPDKVRIVGIDYKVEYVEVVNKSELRYGEIDFMNCVIRIDKTVPEAVQKQTLIHEILHGLCSALGFSELNENENAIHSLASELFCTLIDSPISF